MLRLALAVSPAAIILVFAAWWFAPGGAIAGECRGQWVRASWYGAESGNRTASGLHFTGREWLVAHKSLPFHTKLRLSYRGRAVTVPVEDRGPYIAGRTLDLSRAVAAKLGTLGT